MNQPQNNTGFMSEFDEYIVHDEPVQKEKVDAWQMAIALLINDIILTK